MENKKIKIWAVITIATLVAVSTATVLISNKTQLFKGTFQVKTDLTTDLITADLLSKDTRTADTPACSTHKDQKACEAKNCSWVSDDPFSKCTEPIKITSSPFGAIEKTPDSKSVEMGEFNVISDKKITLSEINLTKTGSTNSAAIKNLTLTIDNRIILGTLIVNDLKFRTNLLLEKNKRYQFKLTGDIDASANTPSEFTFQVIGPSDFFPISSYTPLRRIVVKAAGTPPTDCATIENSRTCNETVGCKWIYSTDVGDHGEPWAECRLVSTINRVSSDNNATETKNPKPNSADSQGLIAMSSIDSANLIKIDTGKAAVKIANPSAPYSNADAGKTPDSKNVDMGEFILTSDENVTLSEINLTKMGTTNSAAIKNLGLMIGPSNRILGTLTDNNLKFPINLTLEKGKSYQFKLTGDIDASAVALSDFTFKFTDAASVVTSLSNTISGAPLFLRKIIVKAAGTDAGDGATTDIVVSPAETDDNTAYELPRGNSDMQIANFYIENGSTSPIKISKIKLKFDSTDLPANKLTGIKLVKGDATATNLLYLAGNETSIIERVIGSDLSASKYVQWEGDKLTLEIAPKTKQLMTVLGSLPADAPIGATFAFKMTFKSGGTPSSPVVAENAGTRLDSGAFTMKQWQVVEKQTQAKPSELTVTSANESALLTKQPNTRQFTAGQFKFTPAADTSADTSAEVSVKSITISMKTASGTEAFPFSKLDKLELFKKDTSLGRLTPLAEGMLDSTTGKKTFNLSEWKIAKPVFLLIKTSLKDTAGVQGKKFSLMIEKAADIAMNSGTLKDSDFPVTGTNVTIAQETASDTNTADNEEGQLTVSLFDGGQDSAKPGVWVTAGIFEFEASDRVEIDNIAITARSGEANRVFSRIEAVQLFENAGGQENQISSAVPVNENGYAEMDFTTPTGKWILERPAFTRKLIIKAKVKPGVPASIVGKTFRLGIEEAPDIELALGETDDEDFPVFGNSIKILADETQQQQQPQSGQTNQTPTQIQQPSTATTTPTPTTNVRANLACEQQGKYTYTGPETPGKRFYGMCIDCPQYLYLANGGKCPAVQTPAASAPAKAKKAKTTGATGKIPANLPVDGIPSGAQPNFVQDYTRPSYTPTPNLDQSQRIVRAPERGNTGPGVLVYFAILGLVQAGRFLRKKF